MHPHQTSSALHNSAEPKTAGVTPALWYHHTFSTLDVWANMPGSLYSLECLHRGNHRPTSATDICQAVLLGCMMVKAGMAGSCFRSLHALISLVATSRKLLHILTGSETATPCGQAVRSVNDLELSSKGSVLVQMMSECVAGIGRQLHQQQGGGGASHPPTGTPVAKRRKARLPRLPPGAKTAPSTSNNQAASEDDDPQCVYSPPSTHHLLHQLLAIQVSSVIQLLHWQVRYEGRDVEGTGTRPSLPEIKVSAGFELAVSVTKDLTDLVTLLLSSCSMVASPHAQREARSTVWESYALKHLQGRLLPGCSHHSCQGFAAVCEVAMRTQLCGGCRRARYCSVECQRAAWQEGCHSKVCVGHGRG